jgi:molybdopterin synthase catalytic subunit/molybdopterin converting factor small subunit
MLRERAGARAIDVDVPDDARVGDVLDRLGELTAGIPVVMAVNRGYADAATPLAIGDELALVPPVSGGAAAVLHAGVVSESLSQDALCARVRDPRAGAVVTFMGVTREVERLEYEAYASMAKERLYAIAADVAGRHQLCALAVEHRIGSVPLSEPSVIVAASAPHRPEAFAAAREAIDRIKAEAPIWKKEFRDGAGTWVDGTAVADLTGTP